MKIMKLTKTARIPERGSNGAAGYDLYADSVETDGVIAVNRETGVVTVPAGGRAKVHTGIAMAIPEAYVGLIYARSGLACKKGLRPSNCVGVIDEDYRGEIIVSLHNDTDIPAEFRIGDRIAQMVFTMYGTFDMEETDSLDSTERGEGGFGSTGSR